MSNLVAYKNNVELKKKFVAEVDWHRKQDMLVQGTYGRQNGTWKGWENE